MAVFSSALFGSISGSAVANVVTTGQVTIPLMKSIGYRSAFAGAVEAAASTGGLIMPPIMGAGAFVMAEILGIPYTQVVKAALIPALLYYGCVLTAVHFEAKKLNLLGLPVESLPSAKKTFREGYHTIVALILLIILLVLNVPIIRTALYTIVAMILLSFFAKKEFRMYPRKIGKALINGMESLLPVAAACATASIVVGVIQLTGVALKFGTLVLGTAGDNLFLTLFFTMIILIVLGMGLPAVASYIIGASVAGPVLTELGVPVLPAHMFIFYFSNLAHITPPIALASYAAAGIAKAGPLETAKYAFFLGLTAFIVPFLFVNNNELLMMGSLPNILLAIASASIGVLSLGAGIVGFLKTRTVTFERVLLLAGGLGLMKPGIITDIFGLAVLLCVFFIQSIRQRSIKEHKEKIFN